MKSLKQLKDILNTIKKLKNYLCGFLNVLDESSDNNYTDIDNVFIITRLKLRDSFGVKNKIKKLFMKKIEM